MGSFSDVTRRLPRRDLQLLGVVVAVECLMLAAYLATTPAEATRLRYTLYPFVWINVGAWAVFRTDPPLAPTRHKLLAGAVAAVYVFVLLWLAGLVGFFPVVPADDLLGISVGLGTPGWERVRIITPVFYFTFLPFRVIGYLALAYLVYVTTLDATTAAVAGAIGFVSCLSCSFSVLLSFGSGLLGGSSALFEPLLAYSLDVSTAVFVLAVAALYYRPGLESVAERQSTHSD